MEEIRQDGVRTLNQEVAEQNSMESGEYHQIHQLKRQPVLKAGREEQNKGYSAGDIAAEVGPKMKEIDSSVVIDERIGGSPSEHSYQLHDEV
ncbi:hypothetical protein NC651_034613 [Populus alba x Populus x berolinensis]|nr:hypothetical protein NC651_034613 [Populus alba x Populus x berolinensis]